MSDEVKKVFKSPDTRKMIGHKADDKTMIYFNKKLPLEEVKRRLALYKKSLTRSSDQIVIFHNEEIKKEELEDLNLTEEDYD